MEKVRNNVTSDSFNFLVSSIGFIELLTEL
jgi:hypothetical protein